MSSLFGNAASSSSNQGFGQLSSGLGSNVTNGANAGNQLASLLGLSGGPAQNQGFTNFRNSTGYQFGLDQGMQSINGSAATQGLLNSGGNEKALQTYGQNYANTQYGNYMNQLQSLLTGGNQSGSVIGQAGNVSTGQGANGGVGGLVSGGIGNLLTKGSGAGGLGTILAAGI